MIHYIYHCYSLSGDLLYVGRSHQPERRHAEAERRYNTKLRLWLGSSTRNIEEACKWEREAIANLHPKLNKYIGSAKSMLGKRHSLLARKRMSDARRGRTMSEESRRKLSASRLGVSYGPHTAEHNLKIGASLLGQKRGNYSAEHKAKISAAHLMMAQERRIEEGLLARRK